MPNWIHSYFCMTINESMSGELNRIKWSHFLWILAGVLLATLVRFPLQMVMRHTSPFFFYIPVVVVAAIIFGKRWGLYATLVSILPANYFWMPPDNAFGLDLRELFQILAFSLAGFSVSWVSDEARKHKQMGEYLRAALASLGDAVVTTDCCGKIVYFNAEAQVLIERNDRELTDCMIRDALDLMTEDGGQALGETFQLAIRNNEIEHLPRRVILSNRIGRRHLLEQKTARILDAGGKRVGVVICFRRLESDPKT